MRTEPGERRSERDCSGSGSDDDDTAARDLQRLGPELRMDDRTGELRLAGELGAVALRVVVVAAAQVQEPAGQLALLVPLPERQGPPRLAARPVGSDNAVAVPDLPVDTVSRRRPSDVGEDLVTVGDGLCIGPGLEREAQRAHVGVRSHPRIAEEVPRAAHRIACLQDREALVRQLRLQPIGRVDPRDAGADDGHVKVLKSCPRGHHVIVTHRRV